MSETTLQRTVRVLFKDAGAVDARRRRLIGLVQGVVTSLGSRLLGMAISFVSLPLTIGYLGTERYGAWVALGSLLGWMALTDFGLGNGSANAITSAAGQDRPDQVRVHVSNAVFMLAAAAAAGGIVAVIAWPFIDWGALLGVKSAQAQSEVAWAAGIALAAFLVQFPMSVSGKLFAAYQEGRLGNYWGMANSVARLLALLAVTQTQGGLVLLVAALSGVPLLLGIASNAWMYGWHRPHLAPRLSDVSWAQMRGTGGVAGRFFLIQILALVTFETDNLVIAHFLGAARVPEYSVTYSLFAYTALPQSLLFTYLWPAYTEAIARKDIAWVRRTFNLNLWIGLGLTAAAVCCLMFVAQPFIAWWAGASVAPSASLVGWVAAWSLVNAFTNPIACLLAAASHLKAQIVYSAVATAANVGLTIYLVQAWGVHGVIAATVIAYLVFVCAPVWVDVQLLLRRLEHAV